MPVAWALRFTGSTFGPEPRPACPLWRRFPISDASKPGRTTADDPVQKFFWKDVYAKRGGTYRYKIVPMGGTPGNLQPMTLRPGDQNTVQLSPHYGALSAYFNRGILATQATAHVLHDGTAAGSIPKSSKSTSTRSAIRCATT